MKRYLQRIVSLVLALLILLPQAVWADAIPKNEVVYAKMNRTGHVSEVFIVNGFEENTGPIVDTGTYRSVRNLTDTAPIELYGDRVEVTPQEYPFYYQGELREARMPWKIEMRWTLDGNTVETHDLLGKTGKLGLSIDVRKNPDAHSVYAENYMLQMMIHLDGEKFTQIEGEGATVATQGNLKTVTFVLMPEQEATFSFTAQGKEMEIGSIQVAALPYSIDFDMPDISKYTNDLVLLEEAIAQLSGGLAMLSKGMDRVVGGVGGLTDGAASLSTGARDLADGMSALSGGIGSLQSGMKQYVDGLESGLANIPSFDDFDLGGWENVLFNDDFLARWEEWETTMKAYTEQGGGWNPDWDKALGGAERLEQAIRNLGYGTEDRPGAIAASEQIRDALHRVQALLEQPVPAGEAPNGGNALRALFEKAASLSGDMDGFADSLDECLAQIGSFDPSETIGSLQTARDRLAEVAQSLASPQLEGADSGAISWETNPEAAQLLEQMRTQSNRLYETVSQLDAAIGALSNAGTQTDGLRELRERARERASALRGIEFELPSALDADKPLDLSDLKPALAALTQQYDAFHADLVAGLAGVDTQPIHELIRSQEEWMQKMRAWLRGLVSDGSAWKSLTDYSKKLRELFGKLKDLAALDPSGPLNQLLEGSKQLLEGQTSIAGAANRLAAGMQEYADGVSEYLGGVMAFRNGLMELAAGSRALADGAGTLESETAGMQNKMYETMNEMMKQYLPKDFTPLSFAAEEEIEVKSVQFVWIGEPLEMEKPEPEAEEVAPPTTFWEKLKGLFS